MSRSVPGLTRTAYPVAAVPEPGKPSGRAMMVSGPSGVLTGPQSPIWARPSELDPESW